MHGGANKIEPVSSVHCPQAMLGKSGAPLTAHPAVSPRSHVTALPRACRGRVRTQRKDDRRPPCWSSYAWALKAAPAFTLLHRRRILLPPTWDSLVQLVPDSMRRWGNPLFISEVPHSNKSISPQWMYQTAEKIQHQRWALEHGLSFRTWASMPLPWGSSGPGTVTGSCKSCRNLKRA